MSTTGHRQNRTPDHVPATAKPPTGQARPADGFCAELVSSTSAASFSTTSRTSGGQLGVLPRVLAVERPLGTDSLMSSTTRAPAMPNDLRVSSCAQTPPYCPSAPPMTASGLPFERAVRRTAATASRSRSSAPPGCCRCIRVSPPARRRPRRPPPAAPRPQPAHVRRRRCPRCRRARRRVPSNSRHARRPRAPTSAASSAIWRFTEAARRLPTSTRP